MNDRVQRPFRILRSSLDAARAAVHHLKGVDGAPQSLDALADLGIRAEVDRLQDEHNAGAPFPVAPDKLSKAADPDTARRSTAVARAARRPRKGTGQ